MVKRKEDKEMAMPVRASKRAKGNKVPPQNKQADLVFAGKPLRPGILEDEKELAQLRTNLRKMDCEGLLEVPWHHEEPEWLQEIWKKDMLVFLGTVRANPDQWKEDMIAEVFGICREGLGLPYKVTRFNHAVQYFGSKANQKEGWKFLECKDDALWDILKFLTPLVKSMKPARVTGKLATTVVECL
jgi:hypothetical protein